MRWRNRGQWALPFTSHPTTQSAYSDNKFRSVRFCSAKFRWRFWGNPLNLRDIPVKAPSVAERGGVCSRVFGFEWSWFSKGIEIKVIRRREPGARTGETVGGERAN